MPRTYLDVHDRVRVDTTPDQALARRAASDRNLLALGARLERFAELGIRLVEARGRPTDSIRAHLAAVRALNKEIIDQAD